MASCFRRALLERGPRRRRGDDEMALHSIVASVLCARAAALSAPPAKARLLQAVDTFKSATAVDGTVPIDFGVKGGEPAAARKGFVATHRSHGRPWTDAIKQSCE